LPLLWHQARIVLVVHTDAVSSGINAADLPDRFLGDLCLATTSGSALPVQRSQEQEEVPRVLRAVQRGLQSRAAAGCGPIGRWQLVRFTGVLIDSGGAWRRRSASGTFPGLSCLRPS